MDLNQSKLSKSEWETIEKPVSESEMEILKLIVEGYQSPNIKKNKTKTFLSYTKIEKSPEIDYYVFRNFFEKHIHESIDKYAEGTPLTNLSALGFMEGTALKQLKSIDSMRIKNTEKTISNNKSTIFEYILIELFNNLLKYIKNKNQKYACYLYTLIQIRKTSIANINVIVLRYIDKAIEWANSFTNTNEIITNAYQFIERNQYLMKYEDKQLYPHQKQLFRIIKNNNNAKLVLYMAPTGTGKTLSPIGLVAEEKRVIFVCVARHIGLALAKSAISVEKKVAFAFGCKTANDIRLHYYSAVEYTTNKKTGGIGKVDNSVGSNVEIMICDVQSYITAMHYMLSFNKTNDIVTYWDEPTITMDYESHELHDIIHNNWSNNKISTVVLSCATLPSREELQPVYGDFCRKFEDAELHTITSHDCKKSIPIINKEGFCELPHYLYQKHSDMLRCVNHCMQNRTLLRYFDLREIITFIKLVEESVEIDDEMEVENYFSSISDITMNTLKEYYLELLSNIKENEWDYLYKYMKSTRKNRFRPDDVIKKMNSMEVVKLPAGQELKRMTSVFASANEKKIPTRNTGGVLATTSDAYTFTDGPTIYLTDEIDKIGQFYIQQSNIASSVFEKIMQKIGHNSIVVAQIQKLEHLIESKESVVSEDNQSCAARESGRLSKESETWMNEINKLRKQIKMVSLDAMYVPNTKPHQQIWSQYDDIMDNAFVSDIGEENAKQIMQMDVDNKYKVLMLLGIGTFKFHKNQHYMEIMKQLADEQKLFMIIASTDYIYGTNYQFCHGFIGKDLCNISQQKIYQSMGRIGRNNIQQDYTIRFRDDNMIRALFTRPEVNLEAINMCRLFQTDEE